MRIIIVTQWFLPEPRRMFLELAMGLQAKGHEVLVITGFPNWPGGKIYPGYKVKFFQKEVMEGVKILRLPLYPDHSRSKIKRILGLSSLAISLVFAGQFIRRPHVVHVVQLPTLARAVGHLCFWRWWCPFTVEVQDMWPESLVATGMMGNQRILNAVSRLCNWMYRRAKRIRVISPGFKQNLIAKGVPAEKIDVISNWIDIDYYQPLEPDPELAKKTGMEGRFNILYAGSIGLPQALDTFLDASKMLTDLPKVQFVIAGGGVEEERLRARVTDEGLTNVTFIGSFPSDDMPKVYALADVLLVHLKDDPLFRITIPSKVLSHLAVGKPTLAAVEGDPADVILQAKAGLACPPQNAEAMAGAVRKFATMPVVELKEMGNNARKAAVEQYSSDALTADMERMLRAACKR